MFRFLFRDAGTAAAVRALPAALLAASACVLAWRSQGSIVAADWLPTAILVTLVLAVSLAAVHAPAPPRPALAALALLVAFGVWTGASSFWSPVPSLARDDALLTLLYATAFATPLVTLRSEAERSAAVAFVLLALAGLSVTTAATVWLAQTPEDLYWARRLAFPLSYPNAEASISLIAFWPALAFAADRRRAPATRSAALGLCVACLAGWLLAQSKGGAVGLAVSAGIVFALCRTRVRLLVPALIAGLITLAGAGPLTATYRAESGDLGDAARRGGATLLVLVVIGVAVGLAYAVADRRITIPRRATRIVGGLAVTVLAAAAVASMVAFAVAVDHPRTYLDRKWEAFKHLPETAEGSTHLTSLGSNRYDFWRVALDEFGEHPLVGIGSRGFAAAYLREGRSEETPQRAHSLELDVLSETGIVGLLLLSTAVAAAAAGLVARARASLLGIGLLGAAAYWLVHASADWLWSFPALGLLFFTLLGIGASGAGPPISRRLRLAGMAAASGAALILFAPPFLSARLSEQALRTGSTSDLGWAHRLDPLSTEPYLAEAELTDGPARINALRRAVEKEPRRAELRYLLWRAYREAGRRREASRELAAARRLDPRAQLLSRRPP